MHKFTATKGMPCVLGIGSLAAALVWSACGGGSAGTGGGSAGGSGGAGSGGSGGSGGATTSSSTSSATSDAGPITGPCTNVNLDGLWELQGGTLTTLQFDGTMGTFVLSAYKAQSPNTFNVSLSPGTYYLPLSGYLAMTPGPTTCGKAGGATYTCNLVAGELHIVETVGSNVGQSQYWLPNPQNVPTANEVTTVCGP